MYNLIEYYEENNNVKYHIVDFADTKEEINKKKTELAKELNDMGIETLEVITTKNINSLKEILKEKNTKVFQVIEK